MTTPAPRRGRQWSLDNIRAYLEPSGGLTNVRANGFMARCPVHNDRTASLSVTWVEDPDRGGMTLLNCHGCPADAEQITEALGIGLGDLFDELPKRLRSDRVGRSSQQRRAGKRRKQGRLPVQVVMPEPKPEVEHSWREVIRYRYTRIDGTLAQEVVRFECAGCAECSEGSRKKEFKQRFVDAHGTYTRHKPEGFEPVLYRAAEITAAIAAGRVIWLLEGEKDADSAASLGLDATTNPQGGLSFPASCGDQFAGATVYVVLDRDDTGYLRGVHLADLLKRVGAAAVRFFLPATTDLKSDFTDHVEAGHWDPQSETGGLIEVTVEELAARAAVHAVAVAGDLVGKAYAEAVERASRADAATTVASRDREAGYARTWAMEAERRFEKAADAVAVVRARAAEASTTWAASAVDDAVVLLENARARAREAHERVGLPVPEALHTATSTNTDGDGQSNQATTDTAAAPDSDGSPDGKEDELLRRGVSRVVSPTYRIVDGVLAEVCINKDGEEYPKEVLSIDARVVEMEYLENEDEIADDRAALMGRDPDAQRAANPPGPQQLVAVIVGYTHPDTGEFMRMRITADAFRDGSWVESLPGPPAYDSRPSGIARLRDALKGAADGIITRTVTHRATGWRRSDAGEWYFIHSGGAIHGDSVRPVSVMMTSPLSRYDLPVPTQDPARIREVFLRDSGALLTSLPSRVIAPLLGQIFRSALGPCQWVLLLAGSPGSFKTSVASLGMHHWGELWDRGHPGASMSGNGDTVNALRVKLFSVKDACFFADDVAPTGGWTAAQAFLEQFARMVYNGEARSRVTRDGQSVLEGTPPRASAIITSEVTPRPGSSGGQRTFAVPMAAGDIDVETIIAFDRPESRHGRALLMASFLQWLADGERLPKMRELAAAEATTMAASLRRGGGELRGSDAVGVLWSGWVVLAHFLSDVGALSKDESDSLLDLVTIALHEAAEASNDPDQPSRTGARVRELIEHALRTGIAHVEDIRTGEAPPWPLAARLGWKRTAVGDYEGIRRYREDARGIRLGYVMTDPGPRDGDEPELILTKAALEQVLKEAASKLADAPQVDLPTAVRALHSEGILVAERRSGSQPPRYTVHRTLHCEGGRRQRMTVLRLWKVLGDDDPEPGLDFDHDDEPDLPPPTLEQWLGIEACQTPPVASRDAEATTAASDASAEQPDATAPQDMDEAGSDEPQDQDQDMRTHAPCEGQYELGLSLSETNNDSVHQAPPTPSEPAPTETVAPQAAPARSEGQPARRTRPLTDRFAAVAAIADIDGVWLPDGSTEPLPDIRHVGQLAELATTLRLGYQVNDNWYEPGQIWVTPRLLTSWGIADDGWSTSDPKARKASLAAATTDHPFVTEAREQGWRIGGAGDRLQPWTRVWKGDNSAAAPFVVLMSGMILDPEDVPVFADDPAPATLARRLQLFAQELKFPFRITAQSTGFDLMFSTQWKKRREGLFLATDPVPPAKISQLEEEFAWSRVPTEIEAQRLYVHCYDRGGSHPSALAGLALPIGRPTHYPDGRPFDAKLPGYWRVEITEAGDWRHPHPLLRRGQQAPKLLWVTTPSLEYARQLGHEPAVTEAYLWHDSGRVLNPYYERIRDARAALDVKDRDAKLARDLLKVVYTRTGGMMGSALQMQARGEGGGYREGFKPEWRHHMIGKAASNQLRRIVQIGTETGEFPVAVTDDTVVYVSDDPNPDTAWPGDARHFGRGMGQYKWEGSALLVDHMKFLTGERYKKGKEELTKAWDRVNGGYLSAGESDR